MLDRAPLIPLSNSNRFQTVLGTFQVPGRGGKRAGAGRPKGTGWLPAAKKLRGATVTRLRAIVGSDKDPLNQVVDMVLSDELDVKIRLEAAAICLPFLYPKLSATTVDSRSTVVRVDGDALIDKINARLERLAEMAVTAGVETSEPSGAVITISEAAA
jgi:hypothetical protein